MIRVKQLTQIRPLLEAVLAPVGQPTPDGSAQRGICGHAFGVIENSDEITPVVADRGGLMIYSAPYEREISPHPRIRQILQRLAQRTSFRRAQLARDMLPTDDLTLARHWLSETAGAPAAE